MNEEAYLMIRVEEIETIIAWINEAEKWDYDQDYSLWNKANTIIYRWRELINDYHKSLEKESEM